MRIVLASSEAVPYSKTGGLADVASALSKALDRAGHDVWLIVPHYSKVRTSSESLPLKPTGLKVEVTLGQRKRVGTLFESKLSGSDVKVILVDQPEYFDRDGLYQEEGIDYKDNCARFVFFSRAVMEAVRCLDIKPDIVHANDWQTGLIPALLDIEYRDLEGFEKTRTVFTIHNMAFQGQFWHWDMLLTGLGWKYFNWQQMEFFDHLNLLKTGIVFSDMVTTVSPTYAQEIQTAEYGCGLEGVLLSRGANLVGILNGVDTEIWNPETDAVLAENYSPDDPFPGKAACKIKLQKQLGLPTRSDVPLFGMISRMTDQKGFDLICECAEDVLKHDLQLCILGSGDNQYEKGLEELASSHPDKVSVTIGFNDQLAHEIEAGSDAFLMPSRYEPCGLNQMYSLMYGTVPVVRSVGGLADSVVDATDVNLANGTATGFCFEEYDSRVLAGQIGRTVEMFQDEKTWHQLVRTGMHLDWSWSRSAEEYVAVYKCAMAKPESTSTDKNPEGKRPESNAQKNANSRQDTVNGPLKKGATAG